ncbi:MAG: sensor histidine kinase [Candidatus Rokuibacteriota bacterium]
MASKVDEIVAATLPLLTRADVDAGAFLHLVGPDGGWLHLRGVSGFVSPEDLRERVPVGEAPLATVGGATVRTLSVQDGHVLFRSPAVLASIRYLACAPVSGGDGVKGLLVFARRAGQELGPSEQALLEAAAVLVETRLERTRLAELLQRAKEQLLDTSRLTAVGQLVPGVAHEVNNPLTTVLGHTQLLLMRPDLSEPLRQRLQLVATESARAARLIQSLLAFARARPADRRTCSLADQARRVLELKAHQLYQDSVRVVTEFGDGPPVHADEHEIQHALLALVQRAHEAMRERSEERVLTVRTGAGGGQVWVDVLDTGPAIGLEMLDRLADPLATATVRGLGLALAHRIATDHGGQLRGGLRPEGGTTFSIVLPAEAPAGR